MNKFHIIVVDDDADAAKAFAELIAAKLHIPVHSETNPDEVLQIVRQHETKVVVLDQRMPNMNGTELYKRIKEINPFVIALMLTGEADRQEVADAISKLKYYDYIDKKDIRDLPSKVMSALSAYERKIADKHSASITINRWNLLKTRFFTRRYEIISIEEVNNNVVFDNKWKVKLELIATEQEVEDSYEYEDDLIIGDEFEVKANIASSITAKILPTLKSEINTALTKKYHLTREKKSKQSKRNKRIYRLQDGIANGQSAIKKLFEYAPLYVHYRIIIKRKCRLCGQISIIPLDVYKQVASIATRVKIFYADGSNQTINTDNISIKK